MREAVAVSEEYAGQPVWQGIVHVFDLEGHAAASTAYAWSSPIRGQHEAPVLCRATRAAGRFAAGGCAGGNRGGVPNGTEIGSQMVRKAAIWIALGVAGALLAGWTAHFLGPDGKMPSSSMPLPSGVASKIGCGVLAISSSIRTLPRRIRGAIDRADQLTRERASGAMVGLGQRDVADARIVDEQPVWKVALLVNNPDHAVR